MHSARPPTRGSRPSDCAPSARPAPHDRARARNLSQHVGPAPPEPREGGVGMTSSGPPSRLERPYRAVLRLLPTSYRAAWEEDMLATYLASVHTDDPEDAEYAAEFGRPGWAEVASVLVLAVRLRLPGLRARVGGPGARPGGVVMGEALRLVALVGLVNGTASFVSGLAVHLWVVGRLPWLPRPPVLLTDAGYHDFWGQLWWVPAGVAWSAAFLAALLGSWRAAWVVAALALLPEASHAVRV